MFDSMYVRVRKSEVRELEKAAHDALEILKELHADVTKLKSEKEMLEKENTFLKGLVDKLASPVISSPNTFKIPSGEYNPWEQPYGPVRESLTQWTHHAEYVASRVSQVMLVPVLIVQQVYHAKQTPQVSLR